MFKIELRVSKLHESDRGKAELVIERRRGESWQRERAVAFEPGGLDASRTLILEDDHRIVVGAVMKSAFIYDAKQNAYLSNEPSPEAQFELLPREPK